MSTVLSKPLQTVIVINITSYFITFIENLDLNSLCQFWSGIPHLPPRQEKLEVILQTSDNQWPTVETCFLTLYLPLHHTSYSDFKKMMDTVLKFGSKGYVFA